MAQTSLLPCSICSKEFKTASIRYLLVHRRCQHFSKCRKNAQYSTRTDKTATRCKLHSGKRHRYRANSLKTILHNPLCGRCVNSLRRREDPTLDPFTSQNIVGLKLHKHLAKPHKLYSWKSGHLLRRPGKYVFDKAWELGLVNTHIPTVNCH